MPNWYSRSVLAVRDALVARQFYTEKLGFHEDWRYDEEGRLRIVQVSRDGCELILSDQWTDGVGQGRIFISLDPPDFVSVVEDFIARGVEVKAGEWGYELAVVQDPDGNRLWFPKPEGPTES